jgi:hypothetical protein
MNLTDTGITDVFDYGTSAELFSSRGSRGRRQPLNYQRFASAAEAIRFAMEDLPPQCLIGAYLEVDESRYESTGIRKLYASLNYPLPRKATERATDPVV